MTTGKRKEIRNVEKPQIIGSISGIPKLMYDHWQVDAIQIATAQAEREAVMEIVSQTVSLDLEQVREILAKLNSLKEAL